jgi:hypothetical protein
MLALYEGGKPVNLTCMPSAGWSVAGGFKSVACVGSGLLYCAMLLLQRLYWVAYAVPGLLTTVALGVGTGASAD